MNWKSFGTALAAIGLLAGTFSAQAADIPRPVYKSGISPVIAYYNWTGFYLGINGGYGWGTSDWSLPAVSNKPKGGMFGGTLGYNYQVGSIVWGLEGDIDWQNVRSSVACAPGITCETRSDWLGTFRGRIGYAFDRWMPYITGGGAYGNVKATPSTAGLGVAAASDTRLGWTFGGGLEYAFLSNWSTKIEYLYVDLGSFNTGPAPVVNNVSFKENIVRAGLNYKFSGPIFSRY
ncbi:MAG: porin family protein [Alphaproteobacteria bacterium]|nr:porin family protein [Alphaproteobacteria bacterium]